MRVQAYGEAVAAEKLDAHNLVRKALEPNKTALEQRCLGKNELSDFPLNHQLLFGEGFLRC